MITCPTTSREANFGVSGGIGMVLASSFSSNLAIESVGEKVSKSPQNLASRVNSPLRGAGDSRPL